MKIYLIPGLGFDCSIFQNLDFEDFKVEYINWIEPLMDETLHDYSKRLFENRWMNDEKIILIGHSLGGIVAQEIATAYKIEEVILISSIKSDKENPFHFRMIKPLRLYKLFSKEISIKTVKYWGKYHGFVNPEAIALFKSMLHKQTNTYLQWTLKALSIWKSPIVPVTTKVFQIHGALDKNFPIKLIHLPDVVVEGGDHVMVYNQGIVVGGILVEELRKNQRNWSETS
jgi:pimeloyl-ACP methyl ester carboxylesterase